MNFSRPPRLTFCPSMVVVAEACEAKGSEVCNRPPSS
jgi:hypothetical protein